MTVRVLVVIILFREGESLKMHQRESKENDWLDEECQKSAIELI